MHNSTMDLPPLSDRSGVTDAVRVQILAAEHWDLLATRSMTWNQIFSRASMFITMSSAVVVALALVAQATNFDSRFRLFALLLLPILLLLGLATFIHLGEANGSDVRLVISLNRLRRAYLELSPELQPYFPAADHANSAVVKQSSGQGYVLSLIDFLAGTPSIVATINVVVVGVMAAFIANALGVSITVSVLVAVMAALAAAFGHGAIVIYRITHMRRELSQHAPGAMPPVNQTRGERAQQAGDDGDVEITK
jgi:hypothetical protein